MEDGEDLISKLPDEILTHVLSFISTERAVSTSVLSKRWKLVWTLVPNLQLSFYGSLSHGKPQEERHVLFGNFVDRVLSLNRVMSVRTVELFCSPTDADALRANAWAQALAMREAEEFDLKLPRSCLVPHTNFNSFSERFLDQKKLVKLTLSNIVLKVSPLVCFSCLKTITLKRIRFRDEESIENLLSGCPALTDLSMHPRKILGQQQTLHIRSSSLQSLSIGSTSWHGTDCDPKCRICRYWDGEDPVVKFVIDAPKLTYLGMDQHFGRMKATYDIVNVSSLVKASITNVTDEVTQFEFLRKISHVEDLQLGWCNLYFARMSLKKLPVFYKLARLTLDIHSKESLTVLPRVLEYTPDGVHIVLTKYCPPWDDDWPLDLPRSISSCIESAEITEENGLSMVSCVLKNGTTSKRLSFLGVLAHIVQENKVIGSFL